MSSCLQQIEYCVRPFQGKPGSFPSDFKQFQPICECFGKEEVLTACGETEEEQMSCATAIREHYVRSDVLHPVHLPSDCSAPGSSRPPQLLPPQHGASLRLPVQVASAWILRRSCTSWGSEVRARILPEENNLMYSYNLPASALSLHSLAVLKAVASSSCQCGCRESALSRSPASQPCLLVFRPHPRPCPTPCPCTVHALQMHCSL